MTNSAKHRRNLLLRAEHAIGLESVRLPRRPANQHQTPPPTPAHHHPASFATSSPIPAAPPRRPSLPATAPQAKTTPKSAPKLTPFSLPFASPVLPLEQKRAALEAMYRNEVADCRQCGLSQSRTHTVFGEGNPDARLMFIGEGPGETEDQTGRPFVGRAGELLDRQIAAMGLKREDVFIANIVKCRPPANRTPAPDETAACTPYLQRQIEIIRPTIIVTLGLPASQYLLQTNLPMGQLRGRWHAFRGIKVMPTYHPAYLLRNYTQDARRAVWADLQQVMRELELPPATGAS